MGESLDLSMGRVLFATNKLDLSVNSFDLSGGKILIQGDTIDLSGKC